MPFQTGLSGLKSQLRGVQRANKFFTLLFTKVKFIPLPLDPLTIISTTFPGREVGTITVNDLGTEYTLAGDVTYNDWEVTIRTWNYLDYNMIRTWVESIHSHAKGAKAKPKDYKSMCTVSQLDNVSGSPVSNMLLKGVFPKSISDITFAEDNEELVTFTVSLNIDSIDMLNIPDVGLEIGKLL